MPENTIYVGRPSKWGNPFGRGAASPKARAVAVEQFRRNREDANGRNGAWYAKPYPWRAGGWSMESEADFQEKVLQRLGHLTTLEEVRAELRGKDLACWCPLDQPCHADVLLEWANEEVAS